MLKPLTALLTALTLAASAAGQCPTPDNLDGGPCCAQTQLHLPSFPAFGQDALDICWKDCDIDNILGCAVKWGKPKGTGTTSCGPMTSLVRLFDPSSGSLTWRGRLRLNYSRTWFETTSAGVDYQVWRFLVNGDMRPTAAAGGPPCPVPSCVGAFKRARFTGYVDWAYDCAAGAWCNAWMLTHACDAFDHAPGFPRTGTFHPDRSYTFVGPAATFVVAPLIPAEGGGSALEAVRRIRAAGASGALGIPVCEFEEQIQHSLVPLAQFCMCSSIGAPQWQQADLFISGVCGTSLFTPGGPFVPGFMSMGVGFWTDPATYPGQEALRWNIAGYDTTDGCTGSLEREVYYGVTTLGGYQGHQILHTGIGAPLPPIYIDQNDSRNRLGLVLMNTPFYSRRVLNLNH